MKKDAGSDGPGTDPSSNRERSARNPGFAAVYREHFEFVWRLACALGVSRSDADDVVQEVFLVVRRRFSEFDPTRSHKAWLAGITRNVVRARWRGDSRRARRLQALPDVAPDDPEVELSLREAARLTEAFISTLDPDKRIAFVLMEVEGLTGAEVAEALGSNLRTIYSRVRVARLAFERYVERLQRRPLPGARHG